MPTAELVATWVKCEIIVIETAGVGLRIDALVIKGVVSRIVHEAAIAVVSCMIRKRTAVANAACAVAVIACTAFGVAVLGGIVVYGVVVGVAITAVLADVVNLCLLWLCCQGSIAVVHV
jgi:hypothetical protein